MARGLEGGFAPLAALSSLAEAPPPAANPHGIDHILARPAAGAGAAAGLLAPRLSLAAAAAGMAHYLQHKPLYWPGFQGLVSNPMAWRERLQSSKYTCFSYYSLGPALGHSLHLSNVIVLVISSVGRLLIDTGVVSSEGAFVYRIIFS